MGIFSALRRAFRSSWKRDGTVMASGLPKQPVYDEKSIPAVKAKKSCHRCHGTGYIGTRKDQLGRTVKVACRCVMKQIPPGFRGDVRLVRNT